MFTHYRCGGVLLPIENSTVPEKFPRLVPLVARCNRCGQPGEIVEQLEPWPESEAFWSGLVPK